MSKIWIGDFRSTFLNAAISAITNNADNSSADAEVNTKLESEAIEDTGVKDSYLISNTACFSWFKDIIKSKLSSLPELGSVIIMLGFNDCVASCIWDYFDINAIANNYVTEINKLVTRYSSANFYICTVNPITAAYPTSLHPEDKIELSALHEKIRQFNEILKKDCKAEFIDTYSYLSETGFSTIDGIRFTEDTCNDLLTFINSRFKNNVSTFVQRTAKPVVDANGTDRESAFWLSTSSRGLNPFPVPFSSRPYDTLPNCTAYAWGRFYEILGSRPTLSTSNAEDWYGYTADGYERGNTPKVGAVICWSKGQVGAWHDDGAGHVAIVEQINDDGSIVTSESGWQSSTYWWRSKRSKGENGNWGQSTTYKFQGFIYNPAVSKSGGSVSGYVPKSQVTSGNFWIPHKSEEMKLNARYIWQYFGSRGWTLNAVAGMLGNLQAESRINPGIWQGLNEGRGPAFGLAQWDPFTKYTNWCTANGYDKSDMDTALKRIEAEVKASTVPGWSALDQWITTSEYNISFKEFTTSNRDPFWLGCAFLINYERPADKGQSVKNYRGGNAKFWYNYLLPYAPDAGPPLTLAGVKISELLPTEVKISFIARGATKIIYSLVSNNGKLIKTVTKVASDLTSEQETEVSVVFAQFDNLVPNTTYSIALEVTDDFETIKDTVNFTTPQSFPESLSIITLVANDTKLPHYSFKLDTVPAKPNFGYWSKKSHGYAVQLLINGSVKKENFVTSLPDIFNIESFFGYTPKIGDIVQLGIRTWVQYDDEKLFDSDSIKASNSICMLEKSIIPYLNTK